MPPAQTLCTFHEERLHSLEEDSNKLNATQAAIGAKLDGLTEQVRESKEELSKKLDLLLEKSEDTAKTITTTTETITALKTKVESLEKTRSTVKKLSFKVALPLALIAMGLLTGASGPSIWKTVVGLLGSH